MEDLDIIIRAMMKRRKFLESGLIKDDRLQRNLSELKMTLSLIECVTNGNEPWEGYYTEVQRG